MLQAYNFKLLLLVVWFSWYHFINFIDTCTGIHVLCLYHFIIN
jgi:hypothetical protein